jgi:23S rRNA (cytosine1962-C5)-methyltransferase
MVFAKTPLASRSLTRQFTERTVHKRYRLLTDLTVPVAGLRVETDIVRAGERYRAEPPHPGGDLAVTLFSPCTGASAGAHRALYAEPLTGRTHQVRVHAAHAGFPIVGDRLYGGRPAARLGLHAERIAFRHPQSGQEVAFEVPPNFAADPSQLLRAAFIEPAQTDAFRLIHGAADQRPGWYVDRLGEYLLSQSQGTLTPVQLRSLAALEPHGVFHKHLSRDVQRLSAQDASPALAWGTPAPERFTVRENGAIFELGFGEGYSVGLFLDQRDNRRRLLVNHVGAGFPLFTGDATGRRLLNTFAYTCAFSVCAALAGAQVTSLDLSKRYLEWGRQNFTRNGLDPAAHDFIFGDVFDWLGRLRKKDRMFDAIVLDPPTFSQSKEHGTFRLEKDYARLMTAALPLLAPGGVLLACANTARLPAKDFVETLHSAVAAAGRRIEQELYVAQPPDFPVTREEPAHLKSMWLRVA